MNIKSFAKEEFIGKNVKIIKCSDPTWEGKSGIIIDETKNTFLVEFGNKQKRVYKKYTKFRFKMNNNNVIINGSKILYRCEDRIKKTR
jgi:ribonuclease P protein subunit POP4